MLEQVHLIQVWFANFRWHKYYKLPFPLTKNWSPGSGLFFVSPQGVGSYPLSKCIPIFSISYPLFFTKLIPYPVFLTKVIPYPLFSLNVSLILCFFKNISLIFPQTYCLFFQFYPLSLFFILHHTFQFISYPLFIYIFICYTFILIFIYGYLWLFMVIYLYLFLYLDDDLYFNSIAKLYIKLKLTQLLGEFLI